MSSKCTAAKAYDILGIYDFPDNFDALNGLHSYLYTNSDMVVAKRLPVKNMTLPAIS